MAHPTGTHAPVPRSERLTAALDAIEAAVCLPAGTNGTATPAALAAAQRALVSTVVPELGQLRQFVVLNYTAVVKARPLPRAGRGLSWGAHTKRRSDGSA